MAYNLTENQKELARRIVQDIRNGILEEEFDFFWIEAGRTLGGLTGDDPDGKIMTRGNVQALCDEGMLRLEGETSGRLGVVVKGRLYEAVDTDFGAKTKPEHPQAETPASTEIDIFISHNSQDKDIADLLVDLLKNALAKLDIEDIRCTSVRGHEFLAGTPIWEQIKADTRGAKVVLALLTPNSLQSTWVLIEIGARLMAGGHLIPVLAKGASLDQIDGPLPTRTILDSSDEDDIDKLVGDLSKILSRPIRSRDSYSKWVRKILELNATTEPLSKSEEKELEEKLGSEDSFHHDTQQNFEQQADAPSHLRKQKESYRRENARALIKDALDIAAVMQDWAKTPGREAGRLATETLANVTFDKLGYENISGVYTNENGRFDLRTTLNSHCSAPVIPSGSTAMIYIHGTNEKTGNHVCVAIAGSRDDDIGLSRTFGYS